MVARDRALTSFDSAHEVVETAAENSVVAGVGRAVADQDVDVDVDVDVGVAVGVAAVAFDVRAAVVPEYAVPKLSRTRTDVEGIAEHPVVLQDRVSDKWR